MHNPFTVLECTISVPASELTTPIMTRRANTLLKREGTLHDPRHYLDFPYTLRDVLVSVREKRRVSFAFAISMLTRSEFLRPGV